MPRIIAYSATSRVERGAPCYRERPLGLRLPSKRASPFFGGYPSSNRTCRFPAYGSPCGSLYSSLPFPEPFQYRFTLVTTASFNLDKRFAARRIICGLPPLTALSGNIFLILMSFAFLFHAEALRIHGHYPASPLLWPRPTPRFAFAIARPPKFLTELSRRVVLLCPAAPARPKPIRALGVGFTASELLATRNSSNETLRRRLICAESSFPVSLPFFRDVTSPLALGPEPEIPVRVVEADVAHDRPEPLEVVRELALLDLLAELLAQEPAEVLVARVAQEAA